MAHAYSKEDIQVDESQNNAASMRRNILNPTDEVEDAPSILQKYNVENIERGVAVIINNKSFDHKTGLKERKGTDADFVQMHSLHDSLGFEEIEVYQDISVADMKEALRSGGI